jgi:hypothetical protein
MTGANRDVRWISPCGCVCVCVCVCVCACARVRACVSLSLSRKDSRVLQRTDRIALGNDGADEALTDLLPSASTAISHKKALAMRARKQRERTD